MTAYKNETPQNAKPTSKVAHYGRSALLALLGGGVAYAVTVIFF